MYGLTDEGRAETERVAGAGRAPWESDDAADPAAELGVLVAQVAAAAIQVGQVGSVEAARDVLAETRRRLYRLLADDETPDGSAETPAD